MLRQFHCYILLLIATDIKLREISKTGSMVLSMFAIYMCVFSKHFVSAVEVCQESRFLSHSGLWRAQGDSQSDPSECSSIFSSIFSSSGHVSSVLSSSFSNLFESEIDGWPTLTVIFVRVPHGFSSFPLLTCQNQRVLRPPSQIHGFQRLLRRTSST